MPTVTINAVDYDVYADLDTANAYLAADFSADSWRAETVDDKLRRALVSATRLLDRQTYLGEKTDVDQLHAFPRTGTGVEGVDDDTVPQDIIDASCVLANLIYIGSKVDGSASTLSGNVRRQRAGSVEIEYFAPVDDATRFPVQIEELIGKYMGAGASLGDLAFGVDGSTITCNNFGLLN